jgi:hypothetical protein
MIAYSPNERFGIYFGLEKHYLKIFLIIVKNQKVKRQETTVNGTDQE